MRDSWATSSEAPNVRSAVGGCQRVDSGHLVDSQYRQNRHNRIRYAGGRRFLWILVIRVVVYPVPRSDSRLNRTLAVRQFTVECLRERD